MTLRIPASGTAAVAAGTAAGAATGAATLAPSALARTRQMAGVGADQTDAELGREPSRQRRRLDASADRLRNLGCYWSRLTYRLHGLRLRRCDRRRRDRLGRGGDGRRRGSLADRLGRGLRGGKLLAFRENVGDDSLNLHRLTGPGGDSADHAIGGRLNLGVDLIGLELDYDLALGDRVAFLDEPLGDDSLFHRHPKQRHFNRSGQQLPHIAQRQAIQKSIRVSSDRRQLHAPTIRSFTASTILSTLGNEPNSSGSENGTGECKAPRRSTGASR